MYAVFCAALTQNDRKNEKDKHVPKVAQGLIFTDWPHSIPL